MGKAMFTICTTSRKRAVQGSSTRLRANTLASNPSIERTPNIRLRLLSVAAHVKR